MTAPAKITLVDDDRNIATSVSIMLEAEGYTVRCFHDGEEGLAGILANPPDLIVLDIKMPRMDGTEVLTRLRQTLSTPVIFLTSKDDEVDELLGLRLGADDYVTKPFSQRLLLERIRAVLRRNAPTRPVTLPSVAEPSILTRGPLELDEERHLCRWKGQAVIITVTEFLLLRALSDRPGVVLSRDQLIDQAYGETLYIDDRTIDSHIKRLRKKFRDRDPEFDAIETLYGVGYRFSI